MISLSSVIHASASIFWVYMTPRYVSLTPLDAIIHYSLSIYFAIPILLIVGYFLGGKFDFFYVPPSNSLLLAIPASILAPISLLFYLLQRSKLAFHFVATSYEAAELIQLVRKISLEQKWTIQSFKDGIFRIKTNPGYVNQSWGQHITIKLLDGGVLINSIFDPSKGSLAVTFGNTQKTVAYITGMIMTAERKNISLQANKTSS